MVMELRNAVISYNGKPALEGIRHVFRPRTVTGIMGPSGSGKTTLLRTLSRMNDRVPGFSVRGQILVDGEDIYGNGLDVYGLRRKVGMVFQKPCVFPLNVFENVVFGLRHLEPRLKKEFPEVAERTLRQVFLWDEVKDRLHKPATTLSQGQQQRLTVARALAVNPRILLMDEPASALDPRSTEAMETLIRSLKPNHTLVLVTHDLGQIRRVSDEVIFLLDGKIREAGKSGDLFENPQTPETRTYLKEKHSSGKGWTLRIPEFQEHV